MKRDENLHPLSWEHHEGLVIAKRLQKGLENGTDFSIVSNYVLSMWKAHLQPHFEHEEQFLVPVMQKYSDAAHANLTDRLKAEHTRFREMVQRIQTGKADDSLLEKFAEQLVAHIRFEERQLFPYAEDVIPEAELETLGKDLHAHYAQRCVDWQPEFWK